MLNKENKEITIRIRILDHIRRETTITIREVTIRREDSIEMEEMVEMIEMVEGTIITGMINMIGMRNMIETLGMIENLSRMPLNRKLRRMMVSLLLNISNSYLYCRHNRGNQ